MTWQSFDNEDELIQRGRRLLDTQGQSITEHEAVARFSFFLGSAMRFVLIDNVLVCNGARDSRVRAYIVSKRHLLPVLQPGTEFDNGLAESIALPKIRNYMVLDDMADV